MIIATAHPPKVREASKSVEKRSIFNDVIQSLRIRSQLPEDINLNDENNIGQNDDRYYENEPLELPSDFEFMPRRNDRIEMPTLKYRFPKSLVINKSDNTENPKNEVVLYINTPMESNDVKTTTQKPKKSKRPTLTAVNKIKISNKEESDSETEIDTTDKPFMNMMSGLSQIGHRESQTVVKPTVIVNFRGSVMHRESDIKLEKRKSKNDTYTPNNVFNIKQEINLERSDASEFGDIKKLPSRIKQNVFVSSNERARIEEDMMMCETASWKEKDGKERPDRKQDLLQILVTI